MDFVGQLWMPMLVATVLCFIASSAIWMVAPHHKGDWKGLPNQDDVLAAVRKGDPAPGSYMVPYCDRSDKAAFEAGMKKFAEGPAWVMYVFPRGTMNMGKMLGQQLTFFLVTSFFVAYVAHHALASGAEYLRVFQVAGATAFMAYFMGAIPESIWFARPWRNTVMVGFDALIYAGLTAGSFGAFWPH